MFGWLELLDYHPLTAMAGGIAAFYCYRSIGWLGLSMMRAAAPGALGSALEFILGVLTISLAVQLLAMAGLLTIGAAQVLAALLLIPGMLLAVADIRSLGGLLSRMRPHQRVLVWWIPVVVVAASMLATAIVPESRADETAYHALVPARILEDRGLRVYPLPWEATIWPQLIWHYSIVPIFATAGSAAARILSFCAAILLAVTIANVVRSHTKSEQFAALACLTILAGGYPTVFFVTLGPHAFGYLAAFTACYAVAVPRLDDRRSPQGHQALRIAIACAGMIAGKITMLPLAVLVMILTAHDLASQTETTRWDRVKILGILVAPSIVLFAPILVWGWTAAHSPVGVMTAGLFHSPEFGSEALRIYQGTREIFAAAFLWRIELSYWNILLAIGIFLSLVLTCPGIARSRVQLLFGCQVAVILLILPKEIRHLGGLQYVLFVGGFCAMVSHLRFRKVPDSWVAMGSVVALAPWISLSLYISSICLPLVVGLEKPTSFLKQFSGLFEDYQHLDQILPANAKITIGHSATSPTQYAWFARPPMFYLPRRLVADDQRPDRKVPLYLLYIGQGEPDPARQNQIIQFDPVLPAGLRVGKNVYTNRNALFYPSRTPNAAAGRRARIDVYEVVDDR